MDDNTIRPPLGWELQVVVPDFGPEDFDITDGMADTYESKHLTKDGETEVYGWWNAVDGLGIEVVQNGQEITLPSPWAARKLADLLYEIAAEAEQS